MARAAYRAMALWVALEFVLRVGGVLILTWVLVPRPLQPVPWPRILGFSAWMVVVAMSLLCSIFVRKVRREGSSWSEIGYRWSWGRFAIGMLGGAVVIWIAAAAALLDETLFRDPTHARLAHATRDADALSRGALIVGNGVLGPVVEELAWRGYVQARLAAAWRPGPALVVTAVAFAVKHMIVDVSISRLFLLVAVALSLGLIRAWGGTLASTIAHLILNLHGTCSALSDRGPP